MHRKEWKRVMDNRYIVGYYPYGQGTDQYMRIVAEESTRAGFPVIDLMTAIKKPKMYKQLKIVNLNWFDSINASSSLNIFLNFIKRFCMLSFFKITGKKIVFTYHNAHPHNMKNTFWADKLTNILCKWSEKIVVLCDYSEELLKDYYPIEKLRKKMVTIPPATYKGCYAENEIDFRTQWGLDSNACVMTYVGSMQPYKNIELVIEAAKRFPDIYFVLAGGAINEAYRQHLIDLSKGCRNIVPMFRRVKDEELSALVKCSSYIITPYNRKSSLNSGVAILAFTYGRTVICPIIGTLLQMGNLDNVFSYDYEKEEEHIDALCEAIDSAYDIMKNHPEKKKNMDDAVLEYIETKNSRAMVFEGYKKMYGDLIT